MLEEEAYVVEDRINMSSITCVNTFVTATGSDVATRVNIHELCHVHVNI